MGLDRMLPTRKVEDYDNFSTDQGLTERSFHARANLGEGISGCAPISTQFENVENRDVVNRPRSVQRADEFNKAAPVNYVVPGTNPDADGDSDGDI